jgi:hypothetical protein
MAETTYYVRIRGRVTGPYSMADLQKLARTGRVSRAYDVSTNGKDWMPAGKLEGVFGILIPVPPRPVAPAPAPAKTAPAPNPVLTPALELLLASPPPPAAAPLAPAPSAAVPSATAAPSESTEPPPAAVILPSPVEPSASAPSPAPAPVPSRVPAARPGPPAIFELPVTQIGPGEQDQPIPLTLTDLIPPPPDISPPAPPEIRAVPAAPSLAARFRRQARRLGLVHGLCGGMALLICLNIPISSSGSQLVWWWDLWDKPDSIPMLIFLVYSGVAGLGAILTSFLARGAVRGWSYLVAAGLGICLLVPATTSPPASNLVLGASMLLPASVWLLVCVLLFRPAAPQAGVGRSLQAVFAGLVCFVILLVAIPADLELARIQQNGVRPDWVMVPILLSIGVWVLSGVCGALGLVGAKMGFSDLVNRAAVYWGNAAIAVFAAAVMATGLGLTLTFGDPSGGSRFHWIQMLRLLVTGLTLSILMATGLSEILAQTLPESDAT